MKRSPIEWKKIFANHVSHKQLISKIYREFIQLNSKKNKQYNFLNGQRLWTGIFTKKINRWPKDTGKCSISLVIREMQTKATIQYHLTPVRMAFVKKIRSVSKDVEKREFLCSVDVNVNWCSYNRKQYGISSKK